MIFPLLLYCMGLSPTSASVQIHHKGVSGLFLKACLASNGEALYWLENRNATISAPQHLKERGQAIYLNKLTSNGHSSEVKLDPHLSLFIAQNEVEQSMAMAATKSGVVICAGNRVAKISSSLGTSSSKDLNLRDLVEPDLEILSSSGRTLWVIGGTKGRAFQLSGHAGTVLKPELTCLKFRIGQEISLVQESRILIDSFPEQLPKIFTDQEFSFGLSRSELLRFSPTGTPGIVAKLKLSIEDAPRSVVVDPHKNRLLFISNDFKIYELALSHKRIVRPLAMKGLRFSPIFMSASGITPIVFDTNGNVYDLLADRFSLDLSLPEALHHPIFAVGCDQPNRYAVITDRTAFIVTH